MYNLLVYLRWGEYLPHTRRLVVPMEGGVLSYTLGHKSAHRVAVDRDGRLLDDTRDYVPPVVHQFGKGAAGKALRKTRFAAFVQSLLDDTRAGAAGGRARRTDEATLAVRCQQCLMADGSEASQRLANFCARRCSLTG